MEGAWKKLLQQLDKSPFTQQSLDSSVGKACAEIGHTQGWNKYAITFYKRKRPSWYICKTEGLYNIYSLGSTLLTGKALVMFFEIENLVTIFLLDFSSVVLLSKNSFNWTAILFDNNYVPYDVFLKPSISQCLEKRTIFSGL